MSLPINIIQWLHDRGITDEVIASHELSWNGTQIVIPIRDLSGKIIFNKYRRDPFGPKDVAKYKYDPGTTAQLFNAHKITSPTQSVIVCEGEMDAMRLEAAGYLAVTSTGGANTFKDEWIEMLKANDLYICFDNDIPGIKGAVKLLTKLPAKLILIPTLNDVKDITNFLQAGGSFPILLERAKSYPWLATELTLPEAKIYLTEIHNQLTIARRESQFRLHLEEIQSHLDWVKSELERFQRVKKSSDRAELDNDLMLAKRTPLEQLYTLPLRKQGNRAVGACPFHSEDTPSFTIYLNQNKFHCFGCSASGDAIDFVMLRDKCTLPVAVKTLLNK